MSEAATLTGSGTASEADVSTGSATAAPDSTSSSTPSETDWDSYLSKLADAPGDKIQSLLEKHPDVAKLATKNVRRAEILRQGEELAKNLNREQLEQANRRTEELQRRLSEIEAASEEAKLSRMTDAEQIIYKREKELATVTSKLTQLEMQQQRRDEIEHRDNLIAEVADAWGLTDEDAKSLKEVEPLPGQDYVAVFQKKLWDTASARIKKLMTEGKQMAEKAGAVERVQSGTSTFAAAAETSPGGDLSFDELTRRVAESDGTDKNLMKLYGEARKKRGYY